MKLQKNKEQKMQEKLQENEEVELHELKKITSSLEFKIDVQNKRITKLLNSIEKMSEMNTQLVITIEEMLYSFHNIQENSQNVSKDIVEKENIEKVDNWVKLN